MRLILNALRVFNKKKSQEGIDLTWSENNYNEDNSEAIHLQLNNVVCCSREGEGEGKKSGRKIPDKNIAINGHTD